MRRLAAPALLAAALLLGARPAPTPDLALLIEAGPEHEVRLTAADLGHFPQAEERVSFEGEHGRTMATYSGVELWTLLEQAGGLGARPRDRVAKVLMATGRDGYTAALALGELDSAFEGKEVLIANAADGHPMADGGLRLVVPGDQRGGRSARDVARIVAR
ncbi:MAG TPA: molybdopterin-dependent oxidoreductase [Acetobacteraceae bacterium]|nr:molybdopterin-dependent oxidoreductase [Acetobacteraceae bacterium]